MTWTPSPPVCGVRQAWLALGSQTVQLENQAGGWFCSSLDLGYPEIRDVTNPRPDQDGLDDRTMYMGGRTVSIDITAITGAGARIDAVASQFAPFMRPSARPQLHYILDRPGAHERVMTVRPSGYAWPVVGADQRDIQLQFMAADPVAYDPTTQTGSAWSGATGAPGRNYPLTFNRIYPVGSGSSTTANLVSNGDLPVFPLLRVYGPISGAIVQLTNRYPDSTQNLIAIYFKAGYNIGAGNWVDIDSARRTAYANSDHTQNVINQIDWTQTNQWPYIAPAPAYCQLLMQGTNTSGITQVQAFWNDRYLS